VVEVEAPLCSISVCSMLPTDLRCGAVAVVMMCSVSAGLCVAGVGALCVWIALCIQTPGKSKAHQIFYVSYFEFQVELTACY
jgi:hypothetical protein